MLWSRRRKRRVPNDMAGLVTMLDRIGHDAQLVCPKQPRDAGVASAAGEVPDHAT
jgi:hypothetical protein